MSSYFPFSFLPEAVSMTNLSVAFWYLLIYLKKSVGFCPEFADF
jgi:hypothetical protein